MSPITTHVLDTAAGRPAAHLKIKLEMRTPAGDWQVLAVASTNEDGRIASWGPDQIEAGVYRLTFETGAYFREHARKTFYPQAMILFEVEDPGQHYHVPLLLSDFGYTTYRGS